MVIDYQWLFLNKSKDVTLQMVFDFFRLVLSFSKSHNSSNDCLDQTWSVYKSKALFCISIILNTFPINLLQSFTSLESLWTSSSSFCQKLSKVFWFSKPWKLVLFIFSFSSPFAKKNSPRTNRLNSFCVSLLPFPKEQRTNRLNSFVSPFSLVKEFNKTQSENSFDSSLSLKQKISKD